MRLRFAGLVAALLALPSLPAMAACGNTSAASSPAEVVQAQVDAYNAHDVEAFATCYADDASVVDLAGKRPEVRGQAALKDAFAFLGRMPRDFGVDIVKRVSNGPVVVDLEHLHGLPPGQAHAGLPRGLRSPQRQDRQAVVPTLELSRTPRSFRSGRADAIQCGHPLRSEPQLRRRQVLVQMSR
jgi:hypothetical protein